MKNESETTTTIPATSAEFLAVLEDKPQEYVVDGLVFYLQTMTAEQRAIIGDTTSGVLRRIYYLKFGVVDAQGEPVFDEKEAAAFLKKKSNLPEKIIGLIVEHSRATPSKDELSGE